MLIAGVDGLLGSALRSHCLATKTEYVGTTRRPATNPAEIISLDLAQPASAWPGFSGYQSAVLCAGITSLEQCRTDLTFTRHINVSQTIKLAHTLADAGIFIVFISTNLVFDGSKPQRTTSEPTCPATEYGRQKEEVERALSLLGGQAAIVRLTKVIHRQMPLLQNWKNQLLQGQTITPFDDLVCAPISLQATAQTIACVAERQTPGVWHLSSDTDISYSAMARQIAELHHFDTSLVRPVSCRTRTDWEHVPAHTTLDASRSAAEIGFRIGSPADTIREMFTS